MLAFYSDRKQLELVFSLYSQATVYHQGTLEHRHHDTHTLLSSPPPTRAWYSVLDLKDAFFSLPLAPKCQSVFAFAWQDPEKRHKAVLDQVVLGVQEFHN